MALLWIEGCEGFGDVIGDFTDPTGIVGRKYPVVGNEYQMSVQEGRTGGYSLQLWNTLGFFRPTFSTTDDTLIVGFAFSSNTLNAGYIMSLYDTIYNGPSIYLDANGKLAVYLYTTRLATSTNSINAGTWYYIEFKVKVSDTVGTYELRVNENVWLSDTNVNTKVWTADYYDTVEFRGVVNGVKVDDIYICDGTGTYNTDFLGNVKVLAIRPDSAGDDTDWTPSSGANYAAVNEVQLDDDATYVETSASADQDLYNYDAVSSIGSIKGVQINTDVRVTDAESYDLNAVIKSGTTEDAGSEETITSTVYTTRSRVQETDPDTAASWTAAKVNSCQFGIKATTV